MPKELGTEQPGARWAGVLILVGLLLLTFLLAPGDSLISFVSDEYFTTLIQEESLPALSEGETIACKCEPVCLCCADADQTAGDSTLIN